jgi:transposase
LQQKPTTTTPVQPDPRSSIAYFEFWGKARPPADRPLPSWHPVVYHLLDVAATMEAILSARPFAMKRGARLLQLEEEGARQLLVTLAGLHDLGKFAPAFQAQVPDLWNDLRARLRLSEPIPGRHTEDGFALWVDEVGESLGVRIWPGAQRALEAIAPAIFGHHGRPTRYLERRCRQGFPEPALAAARACAEAVVELLCREPIQLPAPCAKVARIASWYIAGLMTTADWIGSGEGWFRYTEPMTDDPSLSRYWNEVARPRAMGAVREAGIVAPPSASLRTFREVACLDRNPTPLQEWAESVPLPGTPCLVVIEDVTGAGKTEAAQMLVHRLLVAGRAAGAYWAMPTQATANAMYERQSRMLTGLFADAADPRPSLVLAHGQQRLHPGFRATVLSGATDAIVANPRQVRLIYGSDRKTDRLDAEALARLARLDPKLLKGIEHRGEEAQQDLAVIRAREALVRTRTSLINHVRGAVKTAGARVPRCSAEAFHHRAAEAVPERLRPALQPMLEQIEQLTRQVRAYDRQIETLAAERYPETRLLTAVPGVGALTALAYVLTLEDPSRFRHSRAVGPYLGLCPRRDQSGDRDPQYRITKAGNEMLRRLLVQAAHYQLGPFGPDTDLRRWGMARQGRGGGIARRKAVVGVARRLAVLLHHLWRTAEVYEPLRSSRVKEAAVTQAA